MPFDRIQDHADAAVSRLLEFYKERPNVTKLVRALASRAQVIEDAIADVSTGTLLEGGTTSGAQLDGVGALVGIARNGQTDAVYSLLIAGSIAKNYSTGDIETLIRLCRTLYQTDQIYLSTPDAPGHSRVRAYSEIQIAVGNAKTDRSLFPLILKLLQDAMPVGVRLVCLSTFTGKAFACDGPQMWDAGFCDLEGQSGGNLAAISFQS